jgi:hypothetical protein
MLAWYRSVAAWYCSAALALAFDRSAFNCVISKRWALTKSRTIGAAWSIA